MYETRGEERAGQRAICCVDCSEVRLDDTTAPLNLVSAQLAGLLAQARERAQAGRRRSDGLVFSTRGCELRGIDLARSATVSE
jgi:hypothetical protein